MQLEAVATLVPLIVTPAREQHAILVLQDTMSVAAVVWPLGLLWITATLIRLQLLVVPVQVGII